MNLDWILHVGTKTPKTFGDNWENLNILDDIMELLIFLEILTHAIVVLQENILFLGRSNVKVFRGEVS